MSLFLIGFVLLLGPIACAEEPRPAAPGAAKTSGQGGGHDHDHNHDHDDAGLGPQKAVKFVGKVRNDSGLPGPDAHCGFWLAADEESPGSWLLKIDYMTSDGHEPLPAAGGIYGFDPATRLYHEWVEAPATANPAITSVLVREDDSVKSGEPQKLTEYVQRKSLVQALRVDLRQGIAPESFQDAVLALVAGEKTLAELEGDLQVVMSLAMILGHGSGDRLHYHYPRCWQLRAQEVEEIVFEDDADHSHAH